MRWADAFTEPCDLGCEIWIGPHCHSLQEDGAVGILVRQVKRGQRRENLDTGSIEVFDGTGWKVQPDAFGFMAESKP